MKYAIAAAGIAAVVAIIQGFQLAPEIAVFGSIIVIGAMFVLFVFAWMVSDAQRRNAWILGPAKFWYGASVY